jgi:hypothetical protein
MEKINKIQIALDVVKKEYEKFDKKKTNTAATSSRGALLVMRKLSDELRKDILTEIKDVRTKRKDLTKPVVEKVAESVVEKVVEKVV